MKRGLNISESAVDKDGKYTLDIKCNANENESVTQARV